MVLEQMKLFSDESTEGDGVDTTSTFSDNLSLPIHRWFRYSAGFSAKWIHQLIEQEKFNGRSRVLDPFSGSGTLLLESELCKVDSIGVEAHPFVARIAKAKLHWQENPLAFHKYALSLLEKAKKREIDLIEAPELIKKCFPSETLILWWSQKSRQFLVKNKRELNHTRKST